MDIVIVTYNSEKWIKRCLDSLLKAKALSSDPVSYTHLMCIRDRDKLPLKIWGAGWKAMLGPDKTMVQDVFIENSQIPALYRSARVTLNDHWKDMLDYQFVNNRIS